MIDILKNHYQRFCKFSAVGLLNTAIDFFIFFLLLKYLGFDEITAHVCAFFVALSNSFILNAIWTFKNLKRDQLFRQIMSFILIGVIGLILSTAMLYVARGYMWVYFAKLLAMVVTLVWNYFGAALFVFKKD